MEEGKYETAARLVHNSFNPMYFCHLVQRPFLEHQVPKHSERSNPPKLADVCQLFLCKCFYRLCVKVLNDDKKLWEDEVYKFARKHQLEVDFVCLIVFIL